MSDVLVSVQRLCALARAGSVTLRPGVALGDTSELVRKAFAILNDVFAAHDLEAVDIATTITDTEFIKLAGILVGPSSSVRGSIVETGDALSLWNVRFHVRGLALRPTPPGMRHVTAVETVGQTSAPTATPRVAQTTTQTPADLSDTPSGQHAAGHPEAHPAGHPERRSPSAASGDTASVTTGATREQPTELLDAVAQAVSRGEASEVYRALERIDDPRWFSRAATSEALVLVTEYLVDTPGAYEQVHALLRRAGVPGAQAIFAQLMASTETTERRLLYDAAAAHPAIAEVARAHCNDPVWYVVRNAAGLLGESRSPAMIPDLSRLLRHEDHRVRVAAVVALGRIGGPTAIASLESVLTDASSDVRNRALTIVFASPESDPLADRMLMALEEESTLEFQLEMIHALAHIPTLRARRRLETLSTMNAETADDYQIRLAAMSALAAGHRPAADPLLRQLLDDPTSTIAERAAALLG